MVLSNFKKSTSKCISKYKSSNLSSTTKIYNTIQIIRYFLARNTRSTSTKIAQHYSFLNNKCLTMQYSQLINGWVPYQLQVPLNNKDGIKIHSKYILLFYINYDMAALIEQLGQTWSSHGILLCPAASCGFILGPVGLVHVCNFRNKWIIGVGVCQQRANWQKDLGNG